MGQFDDEVSADAYFMRRLAMARQAQALPSSVQFDLARAPIPDDQLESVITEFGGQFGNGWGFADITHRLLSGTPDTAAVADIKQLQTNLKTQGYLPPSYQPNGIWDNTSYYGLRAADRAAQDTQRAGRGLLSLPVATGMRIITDTLPSRVWQGVVGAAKGLIAQGQETTERVGLLGGAVGGAAIGAAAGTAIAPGVGTAIGAAAGWIGGGVAGFFGDLLGEEPEEEGQSGWENIVDALQPFNEYTQDKDGIHQFFEDLSFVGTAASLASGVGYAARGVTGAVGVARGITAASETVASPGAMGALAGLENVPGTLVRTPGTGMSLARSMFAVPQGATATGMLGSAARNPIATGAVLGGFQAMGDPKAGITDVLEGAAFGAAAGLAVRASNMFIQTSEGIGWVDSLRGIMDRHALMSRPIMKLANGLYTGATVGSIGARMISGELFTEEVDPLTGKTKPAPTTIAREIRDTAPLTSGMEVPLLGDVIDLASFILYPEQILPFKARNLSNSMDRMLGETGTRDLIHAAQLNSTVATKGGIKGYGMSVNRARETVNRVFKERPLMFTKMRVDGAVEMAVINDLNKRGLSEGANSIGFLTGVADMRRTIKEEGKTFKGRSPTLEAALKEYMSSAELMEAWAIHRLRSDVPFDQSIKNYTESEDFLLGWEREAKAAGTLVHEAKDGAPFLVPAQGGSTKYVTPTVVPSGYVQENQSRLLMGKLKRERQVELRASEGFERTISRRMDPEEITVAQIKLGQSKERIRGIDEQIDALTAAVTTRKRAGEEIHVIPARSDTLTRKDIFARKKAFNDLHESYLKTAEPVRAAEEAGSEAVAGLGAVQQQYHYEVDQMKKDGLITSKERDDLLNKPMSKKVLRDVNNHLEARALVSARDIDLAPEHMQYLHDRGYKPVVTGDEIFLTSELDSFTEILEIPQYRRIRNVAETLGLGMRNVKEKDLGWLKNRSIMSSVDQMLTQEGIPLKGSDAMSTLQKYLEQKNSLAVVKFPVIGPVATALKFKADIRRLSPFDIEQALGSYSGMDSRMANKVYQALKRGGAWGEDIEMRHPVLAARQLARGIRVSGLPGLSDVVRGWHSQVDPFVMKGDVLKKDLAYNPPIELVKSTERGRLIAQHKVAGQLAGIGERELREGERFFDVMAESAVRHRPDLYHSVDDFYRNVSIEYREEYANLSNTFKQIKWDSKAPTTQRLMKLTAAAPPNAKDWWTVSGNQMAEMFGGGATKLADGSTISDSLLMVNLTAATSYNAGPKANITFALKQLEDFKNGRINRPGQLPAVQKALDEIWSGNTIDKWGPELQKTHNVAVGKYQNLTGNLDYLTYDTVMEGLYGMPKIKAEPLIQDVAARMKWHVGEVQAAQWVAFKEETARFLEGERAVALKRGDTVEAGKLAKKIKQSRDATTYQDALLRPQTMAKYEEIYGESLMLRTLQQVEDSVRGSITFGPGEQAAIRLYKTGGFDTLIHENAHLLRRIMPENDILRLEEAYGLRRLNGPEGPSPEIRDIASEYHAESGVRQDRDLLDQYAEVDEMRAMRIADAFEAGRNAANDPVVRRSYEKFAQESMDQYNVISKHIDMIPYAGKGQPYKDAAEFIRDVRENHRLYYFKTLQEDAFGAGKITDQQIAENPLLAYSGRTVKDSAGNDYPQTYNDIFRAIHDVIAHAKEGVQTGARGEENAWRAHAAMYTDEARRAMTTETRGQNSWVNFGPHLRQEGKVAAKGEPGYVPLQDRPFAEQKVMLLPEEFSRIENVRWTPEAEERFAEDMTAYMYGAYKGKQKGLLGTVRSAVASHWARNREAFLDAGVVPFGMRRHFDELLRPDMERLGLHRAGSSFRSKQVAGGIALGATEGMLEGDQGFEDTLKGALFGAGVGFGVSKALQKSYGYLPDALANLNMTLRYTLSFTFDLGRISEQNTIAAMKYDLPMFLKPEAHIMKSEMRTPYRDGPVTGKQLWADTNRFFDELNGTNYFAQLTDWEQRFFQRGMLGFAPREFEAVQAMQLYNRGYSKEKINEAIAEIGRYGLGRTNAERSANFVFFPFSFSKKLLVTLGDFIFQTPGRNLLISEGLRRYHASTVDDQFHSLIEDRLPLLEQLWMVNNLAFGASVGRFFLEGLDDRRTNVGRATQILASMFVPSGSATPMQQAFGALGDMSVNLFTPVVLTGESISRAGGIEGVDDILLRYIPMAREIEQWSTSLNDQKVAIVSPQHLTPWAQFREYMEGRDAIEQSMQPMASAFGYTTVQGFLDSPMGMMFKPSVDAQEQELQQQYKQGWDKTTQFDNDQAIDAAALQDLARKPNKTDGEEAFLELLSNQASFETMSQYMPDQMGSQFEQGAIRSYALRWVSDARFAELYDRFLARTYGPIRRVA